MASPCVSDTGSLWQWVELETSLRDRAFAYCVESPGFSHQRRERGKGRARREKNTFLDPQDISYVFFSLCVHLHDEV